MKKYFSTYEIILWGCSIFCISLSFLLVSSKDYLTLLASLIGATFLILNAKGNVWGMVLTVIFCILYGVISFGMAYYGEMITYLLMTMPISIASVVTWFRNPAQKGVNEVKVNHLSMREYIAILGMSVVVSILFYFILDYFHTNHLWLSTLSVYTSFLASYLTMRRSRLFALFYAANDMVLIALWTLAMETNPKYISMVICFIVFLVNDLYGFINWSKMSKKQSKQQSVD